MPPSPERLPSTVRVYSPEGAAEDLAPAEAEERIRSGYTVDLDETPLMPVRDTTTGEVSMVPTERALQRLEFTGSAIASQRELGEQVERESYDTVGNKGLAYGTGLVKQIGLGFGDAGIVKAGEMFGVGREVARELQNQDKYLGGYRMAGEATGFLLPALATAGGYGALRGATAAGRGLAAAGGAVEGAVARGLVRAGAAEGGMLARGLSTAAGQALEMGVYGAGEATSRAVVQNPGLTGEQAVAAMGGGFLHGAAFGALGGAALGAGGALVRSGLSRAGEAVSGAWGRLGRATEGAASAEGAALGAATPLDGAAERYISIVSKGDAEQAAALREAWRDRARLIGKADDTLESAQRSIRKDVDELLGAERRLTEEAQGKLKIDQVRKSVRADAQPEQFAYVSQQVDSIKSQLREMLGDAGAYGGRAQLKEAETILGKVERDIAKQAGEEGFAAAAFTELDYLKRRIGKFSKPGQFLGADQATAQRFREMYDGLRVGLEDTALWGKAAEQQAAINAAWSKQLETKKLFQSRFAAEVGRDELNPFMTKYASDPAKLASYVNGYGRAANDLNHEALVAHVSNTRALADAIGKNYELPAAKAAEVARAAKAAEGFGKTIKSVETEVGATNRLKSLQEEEKAHALGGITGLAVDVMTRPVQTMARAAELEAMAAKLQKKMGDAVQGYLGGAKGAVEGAAKNARQKVSEAVDTAAGVAGRAYKGAELAAEQADARKTAKEPLEKRYTQTRDNVLAAKVNAPQRAQQMAQATAGASPEVTAAMLATTQRAADYLAGKVPPTPQSKNALQPHLDKSSPSTADMAKFLRAVAVVEDPTTVFKSLSRGDITAEEVDALKNVYPEMYSQLQTMVYTEVTKLEKPLPYGKALALGQLMGVPTHPSLAPEFIAAQQAALTAPPAGVQPPARKPMKPSNLARDYSLDTQEA